MTLKGRIHPKVVPVRNRSVSCSPCPTGREGWAQLTLLAVFINKHFTHATRDQRRRVCLKPLWTESEQQKWNNSMKLLNNTGVVPLGFLHDFSSRFDGKLAVLILWICFFHPLCRNFIQTKCPWIVYETNAASQSKYITATITSPDQWMSKQKTNLFLTGLG